MVADLHDTEVAVDDSIFFVIIVVAAAIRLLDTVVAATALVETSTVVAALARVAKVWDLDIVVDIVDEDVQTCLLDPMSALLCLHFPPGPFKRKLEGRRLHHHHGGAHGHVIARVLLRIGCSRGQDASTPPATAEPSRPPPFGMRRLWREDVVARSHIMICPL
jgi:hypothetical protein